MSDDTVQFIADVHGDESRIPDEYVLSDIVESIEYYLKGHGVCDFSMSIDGSTITININKKELKRFKLMGHMCISEYFEEHDTMVARLLPSGHSEVTVTSYIDWERDES